MCGFGRLWGLAAVRPNPLIISDAAIGAVETFPLRDLRG
jgi:hypothetical protein